MFLEIIYESVTLKNIKEKILEYDNILKQHHRLTLSVTTVQFIGKYISESSIGKRLFLCFLLGHCNNAPNAYRRLELPRDFQSDLLFQAFIEAQPDMFLSGSLSIVLKGIDHLIHHNIDNELFDWLDIFNIERFIDPQYKFIDTITFVKCNDKYIEYCFEIILGNKFDERIHAKIFKVFFFFLISNILRGESSFKLYASRDF